MNQNKLERIVSRDFFKQEPISVARQLLGRQIVRNFNSCEIRGRILEVSAWQGTYGEHVKPKFDDFLPGYLSVSMKYGKNLMDITVGNGKSCITLIDGEFEFDGELYRPGGPGNLSRALNVDSSFDGLDLTTSPVLYLEGSPVNPEEIRMRQKKNVPPNCQGYFYIQP